MFHPLCERWRWRWRWGGLSRCGGCCHRLRAAGIPYFFGVPSLPEIRRVSMLNLRDPEERRRAAAMNPSFAIDGVAPYSPNVQLQCNSKRYFEYGGSERVGWVPSLLPRFRSPFSRTHSQSLSLTLPSSSFVLLLQSLYLSYLEIYLYHCCSRVRRR